VCTHEAMTYAHVDTRWCLFVHAFGAYLFMCMYTILCERMRICSCVCIQYCTRMFLVGVCVRERELIDIFDVNNLSTTPPLINVFSSVKVIDIFDVNNFSHIDIFDNYLQNTTRVCLLMRMYTIRVSPRICSCLCIQYCTRMFIVGVNTTRVCLLMRM